MKTLKIIGIILIVVGIIVIVTESFSYKKKEKIGYKYVDVSVKETRTVTWPWYVGGVAVVGGVVLVIIGNDRIRSSAGNNLLVD